MFMRPQCLDQQMCTKAKAPPARANTHNRQSHPRHSNNTTEKAKHYQTKRCMVRPQCLSRPPHQSKEKPRSHSALQ